MAVLLCKRKEHSSKHLNCYYMVEVVLAFNQSKKSFYSP